MLQQFENERRRDGVGHIGHAEVEEGEVLFDGVPFHHLQLVGVGLP